MLAAVALRELAATIESRVAMLPSHSHAAGTVRCFYSVLLTSSPDPEHPVPRLKVHLGKSAANLPLCREGRV